jgi:hypothetical protein
MQFYDRNDVRSKFFLALSLSLIILAMVELMSSVDMGTVRILNPHSKLKISATSLCIKNEK